MATLTSLWARYRRLSLWNKINVWGAVGSVVGLSFYFWPAGPTIRQTMNNSPGGIQAGHGVIVGPPKRAISSSARAKMLEILRSVPPACVAFASTQGDSEAHDFKVLLMEVFREAHWEVRDGYTFMFADSKKGLVVTIPFNKPATGTPDTVSQALRHTGNPVTGSRGDMANECGVYVQVWSAP